jgi:uncharacterized phiE125 gp8 family phage protein
MEVYRPSLLIGPTTEPVLLDQVKERVEIALSDEAHDSHLIELIAQAREEVEHDCDLAINTQTWELKTAVMQHGLQLYKNPIQSITSIEYYDTGGTLRTLPTSVYSFDATNRKIYLKPNQVWPAYETRWDAWRIVYVCGYTTVPAIVQKAVLLLAENYFLARDPQKESTFSSYNRLVRKLHRSTYP